MEITTIACPLGFTDLNIIENAPIWTDGTTDYQVASGPLEDYTTSDPIKAQSDRINIVVGLSGLDALAAMGLKVKESKEV